jgi:flavin reductase (DIM6/NTAB) family NADH-FMN oxidoreductase RutF
MKARSKKDLHVSLVRRYLEPGPVVLVSSAYKQETDIMTMGWHTVMEFTPSLIGCIIARSNHTHSLVRQSGECVINIPAAQLIDTVVDIGNCSGTSVDKFAQFALTPVKAEHVGAPLIHECHANFECRVADARLVRQYDFFILEVVKAHIAAIPKYPATIHYRGDGVFMVSGKNISRRGRFNPDMLAESPV